MLTEIGKKAIPKLSPTCHLPLQQRHPHIIFCPSATPQRHHLVKYRQGFHPKPFLSNQPSHLFNYCCTFFFQSRQEHNPPLPLYKFTNKPLLKKQSWPQPRGVCVWGGWGVGGGWVGWWLRVGQRSEWFHLLKRQGLSQIESTYKNPQRTSRLFLSPFLS